MQTNSVSIEQAAPVAAANVRTACLVAFLIGVAMVFTVGFAHTEILHNAAHDTRHSLAFPCH